MVLLLLVFAIADGFSGRPGPFSHQLVVLPFTLAFFAATWCLLFRPALRSGSPTWTAQRSFRLAAGFEVVSVALFVYEAHHFARLGYRVFPWTWVGFAVVATVLTVILVKAGWSARRILISSLMLYGGGMAIAILGFPLNYLRSDMLPVILWADSNLLHGISPYATMYVGGRVYDFPYLPGMLLGYLPAIAAHLDPRFASWAYLSGMAGVIFRAARKEYRMEVAALIVPFVLCPFLQYRHELYLEPHWFAMAAGFVLMARRHFLWGAFVFGLSMGTYQFSWIVFPFLVLWAWRRGSLAETAKVVATGLLGMMVVIGPFLPAESKHIASNTVGQWGTFGHALADPMNLSFWLTYVIAPSHLLRLQAALMVAIFAIPLFRGGCRTLADTLRWSIVALLVFIMTNSIVDGYFYLMLLVPMLVYTCVANGWIAEPLEEQARAYASQSVTAIAEA